MHCYQKDAAFLLRLSVSKDESVASNGEPSTTEMGRTEWGVCVVNVEGNCARRVFISIFKFHNLETGGLNHTEVSRRQTEGRLSLDGGRLRTNQKGRDGRNPVDRSKGRRGA